MGKVLVFAGTYRQACEWGREQDIAPRDMIYVQGLESLLGCDRGTDFVKVGTWNERQDAAAVLDAARSRGLI